MEEKSKKKVLVVDNDESLRVILTDELNNFGFEAMGAANGQEGLDKALEWHPDMILLDILMPVMGGWEMLEKLREDEWGKKVKVVMLTGIENSEAVARAVQDGSFAYLVKTNYTIGSLVEKVDDMLKK